jgi:hypothetical protein
MSGKWEVTSASISRCLRESPDLMKDSTRSKVWSLSELKPMKYLITFPNREISPDSTNWHFKFHHMEDYLSLWQNKGNPPLEAGDGSAKHQK